METTYTVCGLGSMGLGFLYGIEGLGDGPNTRLAIDLPSGLRLSIVYGAGTFSGPDTVEVAVIDRQTGDWRTREVAKMAFGEELDDDVEGYCDADRVHGYFIAAQSWKP